MGWLHFVNEGQCVSFNHKFLLLDHGRTTELCMLVLATNHRGQVEENMFVGSMRNVLNAFLVVVIVCMLGVSMGHGQQNDSPTNGTDKTDFQQVELSLDASNSDDVRIKALDTLLQAKKYPEALGLLNKVKQGLKDPNDELRFQYMKTLSFICKEHNKECPIEFLSLIHI